MQNVNIDNLTEAEKIGLFTEEEVKRYGVHITKNRCKDAILIETVQRDYVEATAIGEEETYVKGKVTVDFRYIKNGIELHGYYKLNANRISDNALYTEIAQLETHIQECIANKLKEVKSEIHSFRLK
jgi:hypothetical protein